MEYILSVDIGTSAVKVALFDNKGKLIRSSTNEYLLLTPSSLAVELGVETYWIAFKNCVRKIVSECDIDVRSIKALGISAQGETLVVIDEKGTPIRNAIVWMDNRAQQEASELDSYFQKKDVYGITGQVSIVPTWPASKIYWLKQNEKETFDKVYKYLLIEDYFIFRLTGEFAAEGSLLCSTLYWDIAKKVYWREMLDYLEISEEQLPGIYESGEPIGSIMPSVADELGLSTKTIVFTGVLDQVAGAIGVGNVKTGIFSECTGSALAIVATVDHQFKDPEKRMPCHYHGMPDTYMAHTFTTGGMVMKWFRDKFCESEISVSILSGKDPYTILDEEASRIPCGSEGLVMLPHLQGAMAPENNPKAKGVYFGINLVHTKAHFIRSIFESIAFVLRRNIEVIEDIGINVDEIRSLGGGARSDTWNQIKADITGKSIVVTGLEEEACLGAAIVAGTGAGMFGNIQEASSELVKIKKRFEPNEENSKIYEELYRKYLELYKAVKLVF